MLPQEALDFWSNNKASFARDYVKKIGSFSYADQASIYWVMGLIEHFATEPQDINTALRYYEAGRDAAIAAQDYTGWAQNLAAIGCVQRVYGTKVSSPEEKESYYAQARTTLNKAMELAQHAGYTKGWMDAAGQLSLMMSPAEKYAFNGERLPVARELMPNSGALVDLIHTQAVAAVELGTTAANIEDKQRLFEEVETYFQESFALTETLPETEDREYKRIWNYTRYGEFLEQKNDTKALGFLQRAVEMAHGYRDGTGNADAIAQAERSRDAYLRNHPEMATTLQTSTLFDFEQRFNLARAAHDIPVMIESLIGIASKQIETLPKNVIPEFLQNEQSYRQACAVLKQAVKLAETHNLGDLHFAASRQFLYIATPEHINQFFGRDNPLIAAMSTQLKQNG